MKRLTQILGVILVAGGVLACESPVSLAGRTGGPMSTMVRVPAAQSVFFDVAFDTGSAIVAVNGNGNALIQVFIYDSEGHVATGVGSMDRKVARLEVYRPGMFRVEVVNGGIRDDMVSVTTN